MSRHTTRLIGYSTVCAIIHSLGLEVQGIVLVSHTHITPTAQAYMYIA